MKIAKNGFALKYYKKKSSVRAGLLLLWQKMGYFLFFSV